MAIPALIRRAVYARDEQRCQRCAIMLAGRRGSIHHRTPGGMGGRPSGHTMANLVLVCGTGTTGCHGVIESYRRQAAVDGWLVPHGTDPATVPVLRYGMTRSMLGEVWTRCAQPA